ncbi:MAG TPA: type II secretion system protein GspL [Steroidobacter sp.]|jgi:general secretion pathway protein L|nr:type II secretion system protein GspL [Steroidobacteraceae bacterium]HLS81818.1 type II secretion system protein GspL [Steroidobacter sp.]
MAEALIVRLLSPASPDAPQAQWLTADPSGPAPGAVVHCGALTDAAPLAVGRRLLVLVPGADTLLAEPVLPVKSGAKLAQVVPFALEEQLADDIDDLHFATGRREGRPGTPVVVVAHERMRAWRDTLAEAGLSPDAIYAETAALPETANGVTLVIDGRRVYVRRQDTPGAVLEVEPLIEALQLALSSGEEAREHVTIYVCEDDYERERDLLEGLREFTASLQLKLLPDGPLPLFAGAVLRNPPVNLLQGAYAAKTKLRISLAPWRQAAMLAAVFAAAHFGLMTWRYFENQSLEARLDEQITQVFQQAMPGAPTPDPSAARKQLEMRLAQLRGGAAQGGMLAALATVSEALAQAPGASIEALSYRNDTTDLRVLAPSVDAIDQIRQTATQRGVSAEIQSANPRDSKFEGRLQLKGAGA